MGDWHWQQCRKYFMRTRGSASRPTKTENNPRAKRNSGRILCLTPLESRLGNPRTAQGANSIHYASMPVITIIIQNSVNC